MIIPDQNRLGRLTAVFRRQFGGTPSRLFSSPGRAEIVGNHTDHQGGRVLVSAISCDILCLAEPRSDGIVEIVSEHHGPIRFSVGDLSGREREKGKSVALARGVMYRLAEMGYSFGGFSAVTDSVIFRGAGVSSSAAFEVLVAELVNRLYCGGKITPLEKAAAAQFAENVYFGKPCGLLDQSGVAFGGLNRIDFGKPSPAVERVPAPAGYRLVLVNTGGSHAALTSHYADIRREMGEVAAAFGKSVLGEVPFGDFLKEIPDLRKRTSDRAIVRAFHFYEENRRVDEAARALCAGDIPRFLRQVRESGESSLAYLQNCFVPGELAQPIVLALKMSASLSDGACRMMGGGFAGAVLAFCREGTERRYGAEMARVFGRENVYYTDLREEGTTEIEMPRQRM